MSFERFRSAVAVTQLVESIGRVHGVVGPSIAVTGLAATIGTMCRVRQVSGTDLRAEVVGVQGETLTLMPYGPTHGLASGCEVFVDGARSEVPVGDALLGRVIDGFGEPLDGRPAPACDRRRPLLALPTNPMHRPKIARPLETGVRSIDGLLTLGQGQRVGIFAGSGVGKSTLLGMIARHVKADVNVIALIGERGREAREFVENQLGEAGLRRSVVVLAAADQPALSRVRAAHAAIAIAEHFRDQGRQVLLTMDSITRLAMARREIGLAAGEPPTARGYTPSVFAELPELCERCGTSALGGAITALMTVLVEGDDMSEPIADHLRAILDGHIVLSRQLAHAGHYPAVDVLRSASRVMGEVVPGLHKEIALEAIRHLAVLDRYRQLVDMGAYEHGSNPPLDRALVIRERLNGWLMQREGGAAMAQGQAQLKDILSAGVAANAAIRERQAGAAA